MSNLRPYHEPDSFQSPVRGHGGLTIVHSLSNSSDGASGKMVLPNLTVPSSGNQSSFVYLDISASEDVNTMLTSLVRLYSRNFIAQPLEVCRYLLQVGEWSNLDEIADEEDESTVNTEEDEEDEIDDELNYFTAVSGDYAIQELRKKRREDSKGGRKVVGSVRTHRAKPSTGSSSPSEQIEPVSTSIFDIMAAVMDKDGVKGLWRGSHTTFIIDVLASMVEAWLSGFLSSVSGIPDPQFVEVLHSPSPMISLGTAVTASVLTAILLSPLDVIRSKFTVTTFASGPRSFRTSVFRLKSYLSPVSVLIPTVFQSGLASIIRLSTPYVLYAKLGIDSFNSPSLFNFLSLVSSLVQVSVRLPFETLTRRAQVDSLHLNPSDLIVRAKAYRGVVPAFWDILTGRDEAVSLFRGWRLSALGAAGEWGVRAIQNEGRQKEHF